MQEVRANFTNHRFEIIAGFLDIALGILHPLQPIVSRTVVQLRQSINPCTLLRRWQFAEAHQGHTNALLYQSAHQFLGVRPDATTVSAVINTCIPDPRLAPDANLECRCNLSREIVQCSNDAPAPMLDHPADRTSVCRVVCPGMGTSARVRSPKPRASSDRPARRGFQCDCRDR